MSKEKRSTKKANNLLSNPVVLAALITVIGSIITTLILAGADVVKSRPQQPQESPTPEYTATLPQATTTFTMLPSESPPASTETLPPPTETKEPTPVTPPLECLDRWEIISSEASLVAPGASGECKVANVPGLGITTSNAGLSFGQSSFREQGLFGIATSIPADATIRLRVEMTTLTQGEFWIALSNTPQPDANMLIFALQPQYGEMRYYLNQTETYNGRYYWEQLSSEVNFGETPPYIYEFVFTTSGNEVNSEINLIDFSTEIVNLPNYLFLGYRNKSTLGSVTMKVKVTKLEIALNK